MSSSQTDQGLQSVDIVAVGVANETTADYQATFTTPENAFDDAKNQTIYSYSFSKPSLFVSQAETEESKFRDLVGSVVFAVTFASDLVAGKTVKMTFNKTQQFNSPFYIEEEKCSFWDFKRGENLSKLLNEILRKIN